MESLQGSWQYENFSSAKEISPPISPAPPSPTFYSPLDLPQLDEFIKLEKDLSESELTEICFGTNVNTTTTSPFLLGDGPSSLLCPSMSISPTPMSSVGFAGNLPSAQLEGSFTNLNMSFPSNFDGLFGKIPAWKYFPDMDFRLDEPSLNLEAFEELNSLDDAQVNQLMDDLLPPKVISEESVTFSQNQVTGGEDHEATFKSLMSELGLPTSVGSNENISVFEAETLLALKDEGVDLGLMEVSSAMDEDSDSNSSVGSPSSVAQEIVVYTTDDSQTQFDSGFAIVTIDSTVHSSDSEDEAQEMTIDALLQGDFEGASAIYPAASIISKNKTNSLEKSSSAITKASLALIKPERRGRKPSAAANTGKTWVNLTDKVQRKKEQNKTAATRYRQKKKVETLVCLEQEKELEAQNDVLKEETKELAKNIKLFKQLLREVIANRKASKSKASK